MGQELAGTLLDANTVSIMVFQGALKLTPLEQEKETQGRERRHAQTRFAAEERTEHSMSQGTCAFGSSGCLTRVYQYEHWSGSGPR